jgi:hypothetical protein
MLDYFEYMLWPYNFFLVFDRQKTQNENQYVLTKKSGKFNTQNDL